MLMSFFLDPPALFLAGIAIYYLSKRFRWGFNATIVMMGLVSLGLFMGGSTLLYMDVVGWPLPPTNGSSWMFHTQYTGIEKASVHVGIAVLMLLIYPAWNVLGYLLAVRMDTGSFMVRVLSPIDVKSRREKPQSKFVVVRGEPVQKIIREAISQLGGIQDFVRKGNNVIIKVNICGGNPTINGSYTSPELVAELVEMIREVGAESTIVDSDMIWTKFDPVAEAEGWKEWAMKENWNLVNLAETEMVRFNFGENSAIGIVPVSRMMVEADVIISVPTMKTHLLTSVTCAMKNMYGTFPEENKAKYHRFGIEDVIFEVNKAFTPHLTIIDGSVGGESFGPLSSSPVDFHTIIASNDVVAADSVACQLMGYDPLDIIHIKKAHEEDLGDAKVQFDFSQLPYSHPKDGKWEKPDPSVSGLYEGLVEAFLLVPGMQSFFDAAADLFLFEMATQPILRELTPEVQRLADSIISDVRSSIFRSGFVLTEVDASETGVDEDRVKVESFLRGFWEEMMNHD
jgi:uncharacterized protein (DUF362 family)